MSLTNPSSREYREDPLGAQPKRRNLWIWISVILAVLVVGLLAWQLATQTDLDKAQKQVAEQQAAIDEAKTQGGDAAASYKTAYQDLEQELGVTQKDLTTTEQELESAQQAGDQAQQDAAAAQQQVEQAETEQQKASAEADQAKAEAEAAAAKTTIVNNCANTFLAKLTTVAQSEDPNAAAQAAKQELQNILSDCKAALSETS